MPTKAKVQFKSWSFSRYKDYDECPLKAKLRHLDKVPFKQGPALARGSAIHEEAEHYVKGVIKALPESLKLFKKEFAELRKLGGADKAELQLVFTKDWVRTVYNDWDNAWLRTVLDQLLLVKLKRKGSKLAVAVARAIDYKTGKIRLGYEQQLELYALVVFIAFPEVEEVDTELWYLDQGELIKKTYKRSQLENLQKLWNVRTKAMLSDTKFVPRPGQACRYCDVARAHGGVMHAGKKVICKF